MARTKRGGATGGAQRGGKREKEAGAGAGASSIGAASDREDASSVISLETTDSDRALARLGGAVSTWGSGMGGMYEEEDEDDGAAERGAGTDVDSNDFADAVDLVGEKRESTRERGLTKVTSLMLHAIDVQPILSSQETLESSLISILRSPGPAEGVLATRAVAVLCVLLGADEDELSESFTKRLYRLIRSCKHSHVRVGAVHALAIVIFICSTDEGSTKEALDFLSGVFGGTSEGLPVPSDLAAAALQAWGLLASSLPPKWVAFHGVEDCLGEFATSLRSPHLGVRMAAGENIALLHECRTETGLHHEDDEEIQGLWDEVTFAMQLMGNESSKRMSKESRKRQRRTFRELYSALAEDAPPEETEVTLVNGTLCVDSWAKAKQVNSLRMCLQSGFQTQLQHNETLREVLEVDKWGGTGGPKTYHSKSSEGSKQATNERARGRASRQHMRDHFLDEA